MNTICSFFKRIFDFIIKLVKNQSQSSPNSWWSQLIRRLTTLSYILLVLLILTGLIPIFRVKPDDVIPAFKIWFSVTFFASIIYFILRGIELSIRDSEIEEERRNAHHLRELQWEEINKAQKRESIERGIRIANACTELINSPKFDQTSKEEARLLLIQIFQDEEAVDNFIKYSNLSKFSTESLGQAKDDSVVLSAGEDLITVQDIRKIESAIGSRFSLFLSTLKDWSRINKNGVKALTPTETRMAKTKLIDILEIKFKKTKKLSGNFKEHFKQAFTGRM